MIAQVGQLSADVGVSRACASLALPRSAWYRTGRGRTNTPPALRPQPPRALNAEEKAEVRSLLNSERFQDSTPRQVYGVLLDEGRYLCHWRTMYRILAEHAEVRERRNQLRHPRHAKPHLRATGPNQVWSWDITKLRGPQKWQFYYLYVIIDIYSRCVVGWLLAERESAALAEQLLAETCARQGVIPEQLTVHADHGSAMISKTVALLLADLGVTKSHARPRISNDNPYSEAQFKTLKYRPDYPDRFGSLQDARQWARGFFHWYNHEHRHSSLGLMTPATVHDGKAMELTTKRQAILLNAYRSHPERFVQGAPTAPRLSEAVWINPPASQSPSYIHQDTDSEAIPAIPSRPFQRTG